MKKITFIPLLICLCTMTVFGQNGLKADYYNGTNFNQFVGTKYDTEINHYWDNYGPFKELDPHECSVRWTGQIMSPETGAITFSARVDDGVRLWVGGVKVIDNWQLNDVGFSKGKVHWKRASITI